MTKKIFSFDPNKCTGCNACQIACILENELDYTSGWRQVVTYNEHRHPGERVFHLSMACNHCDDPPCLKYCPTLAYKREDEHDTVQIDPEKCIGCKYCSWVCPFDAPKIQSTKGVMEKCTFCLDRLNQNQEPACVTICPTDALESRASYLRPSVPSLPGITKTDIHPSLEVHPLRKDITIAETYSQPYAEEIVQFFRSLQKFPQDKINPGSEWTLIVFSLLVSSIVGYSSAAIIKGTILPPLVFLMIGFAGFLVSSLHLGKKPRAYRFILNWRCSWLSREIILYATFLFFAAIYNFSASNFPGLGIIVIITGFFTLVSMDMVYSVIPQINKIKIHSSSVSLSGLLFLGFFFNYNFFAIVLILKYILYFSRQLKSDRLFSWSSLLRIFFGFILAPVIWYLPHEYAHWISFACLLTGELADRVQFYQELDIVTPYKQMNLDLMQSISGIRSTKSQSPNNKK